MTIPPGNFAADPADGRTFATELERVLSLAGAYTDLASPLKPQPVQLGGTTYAAAAGQTVPWDLTNGLGTMRLPSAPPDFTFVAAAIINQPSPMNVLTVTASGTDSFELPGNPTVDTVVYLDSVIYQYSAAARAWVRLTNPGSPASAPLSITRDPVSGQVTAYTDPSGTTDLIVYGAQGLLTYRENGVVRTVQRDSNGNVTGVV